MKLTCVKVTPLRMKDGSTKWDVSCPLCGINPMLVDDLRTALRLAKRHVRECPKGQIGTIDLKRACETWIIGYR